MAEELPQIPPPVFGVYDWDSLFSFFLTQLAYTLKDLNDRYREIKVYSDTIKDENFIKTLKTAVVYALYLVRLKKTVITSDKEYLENVEKDLKGILENDLKNITTTIEFDKALDIWLKILEYVSRISYGVRVIKEGEGETGEEKGKRFIGYTLE